MRLEAWPKCPFCETTYGRNAEFCTHCGKKRPEKQVNRCENKQCSNFNEEFPDDIFYCGLCGTPTTRGKLINEPF